MFDGHDKQIGALCYAFSGTDLFATSGEQTCPPSVGVDGVNCSYRAKNPDVAKCHGWSIECKVYALEASMRSTASVPSASNILCIPCKAASLPDFWPAYSWSQPLAFTTCPLATFITHLTIILRITSPTPVGLTAPWPFSRGINRLATSGLSFRGRYMLCMES